VVRKVVQRVVRGLLIQVRPPILPSSLPTCCILPILSLTTSLSHSSTSGKTLTLILGAVPTVDDFGIMGIVLVTIIAISTGVVVDGI
jgi:hypothetical protein